MCGNLFISSISSQSSLHAAKANVHALEPSSGRSALHKAAYWGHFELCKALLTEFRLNSDVQDYNGDTALHDACRFGHVAVVETLLASGCNTSLRNKQGQSAADVARFSGSAKFGIEKKNFDTVLALLERGSGCPARL
jgi:ankyrin repeat protein